MRQKYQSEIDSLKEQLSQASEHVNKDREAYVQDNERLKQALQEMEKEYSEV